MLFGLEKMSLTEKIQENDKLREKEERLYNIFHRLGSQFETLDKPLKYTFSDFYADMLKLLFGKENNQKEKLKKLFSKSSCQFNTKVIKYSFSEAYKDIIGIIFNGKKQKNKNS